VRSEVAAFPVDGLDALRTLPVWAFCFLSKGCSSQFRGIFLGWAVEKGRIGAATGFVPGFRIEVRADSPHFYLISKGGLTARYPKTNGRRGES
jgi:hypothetical protein